jgi:predicted DNA binding CopG/RHH family protein
MTTDAQYEREVLAAYETGKLRSVATKAELAKLRSAARATAIKDRRVNIRLSAGDLQDIQVRALEEGMPYQTLIASVLHKYVTGRLEEREPTVKVPRQPARRGTRRAKSAA